MSLLCQCTIRSGVLNRKCPWMRPVLQSGHGVAAARQGIGRAMRIGPSDGSQVIGGWKKGRSEFLILAMSPFLLRDQQAHPQAVRGMPDVPIAPPATGPPEGWAAVGLVSPASFNRGFK